MTETPEWKLRFCHANNFIPTKANIFFRTPCPEETVFTATNPGIPVPDTGRSAKEARELRK